MHETLHMHTQNTFMIFELSLTLTIQQNVSIPRVGASESSYRQLRSEVHTHKVKDFEGFGLKSKSPNGALGFKGPGPCSPGLQLEAWTSRAPASIPRALEVQLPPARPPDKATIGPPLRSVFICVHFFCKSCPKSPGRYIVHARALSD